MTAFSPRGRRLAVADASEITIWSTRRGVRLSDTVEHGLPVNDLVFSPDGNTLFSASDDETLQAWDLPAGARGAMLRGHEGPVERCRLSPDGRWLASEGADRRVKVWDLESGRERSTLAARGLHGFTADGRLLVCAHGWVVQLWDRERALAVAEYVTGNRVTAVGTDRSGRRIAVGCEGGGVHLLELHADTRRPRFPNTPTGSRNG